MRTGTGTGTAWIQSDTAGYSGSAAKWLDAGRIQRDTKDTVRYRQDTGGIRAEYPKNTCQGRALYKLSTEWTPPAHEINSHNSPSPEGSKQKAKEGTICGTRPSRVVPHEASKQKARGQNMRHPAFLRVVPLLFRTRSGLSRPLQRAPPGPTREARGLGTPCNGAQIHLNRINVRLTPWALSPFLVGVLSAAAAIRKLPQTILTLAS